MQSTKSIKKAAFCGSFDPPTFGHIALIRRAVDLFSSLSVVIAENSAKQNFFSVQERSNLLCESAAQYDIVPPSILICPSGKLLVNFLQQNDITVVIRGLRNAADFEYEKNMASINKKLYANLETIFLCAEDGFQNISSTTVRELALCHADISAFAPQAVINAIKKRVS